MKVLSKIAALFRRFDEEPVEQQRMRFKAFLDQAQQRRGSSGQTIRVDEECDQLPNASGPFGLVPDNPIPVNGPSGEALYLNTLRTPNRVPFFYHRVGATRSSATSNPVDVFELVANDGSQYGVLYFSMYHPRRSNKIPVGFKRLAWSNLDDMARVVFRWGYSGTTRECVEDFPFGLPKVIENTPEYEQIGKGAGIMVADIMRKVLSSNSVKIMAILRTQTRTRSDIENN